MQQFFQALISRAFDNPKTSKLAIVSGTIFYSGVTVHELGYLKSGLVVMAIGGTIAGVGLLFAKDADKWC